MSNAISTVTSQAPSVFVDAAAFDAGWRMAEALARSKMIPVEYQGKPENTLIAIEVAQRTGASPLAVMQNLYIVHGKPGWSAQYIIAAVNASGRYSPLRFEMRGEGNERSCIAWATDRSGERLESPPVSIEMAKLEGWSSKNGSKWKTMPELMLRYRAATLFGRLYAPEILMGMKTADEIEDVGSELKDMGAADEVKPAARALPASRADKARAALAQRKAAAAVTIEAALDAIHQAATPEALKAAGQLAAQLDNDDDKATARDAYATRKAQLLAAPQVDADTGELLQLTVPVQPPEPAVAADPMAEHADFLADMA